MAQNKFIHWFNSNNRNISIYKFNQFNSLQQYQQEDSTATASAGVAVNQSSAASAIDCIQNTLQINKEQNSDSMARGKFIQFY